MEITTVAILAVNYHYNLSSKLKAVMLPPKNLWVCCKGLWQKKCILYSLLQYWPHPGRLHLLVHLQSAAACQHQLRAHTVHPPWGTSVQVHTLCCWHAALSWSVRSLTDGHRTWGCTSVWEHPHLKSLRISFLIKALWRVSKWKRGFAICYWNTEHSSSVTVVFSCRALCVLCPAQAVYTITGVYVWDSKISDSGLRQFRLSGFWAGDNLGTKKRKEFMLCNAFSARIQFFFFFVTAAEWLSCGWTGVIYIAYLLLKNYVYSLLVLPSFSSK